MLQHSKLRPVRRLSAGEFTGPIGRSIVDEENLSDQMMSLERFPELTNERGDNRHLIVGGDDYGEIPSIRIWDPDVGARLDVFRHAFASGLGEFPADPGTSLPCVVQS